MHSTHMLCINIAPVSFVAGTTPQQPRSRGCSNGSRGSPRSAEATLQAATLSSEAAAAAAAAAHIAWEAPADRCKRAASAASFAAARHGSHAASCVHRRQRPQHLQQQGERSPLLWSSAGCWAGAAAAGRRRPSSPRGGHWTGSLRGHGALLEAAAAGSCSRWRPVHSGGCSGH